MLIPICLLHSKVRFVESNSHQVKLLEGSYTVHNITAPHLASSRTAVSNRYEQHSASFAQMQTSTQDNASKGQTQLSLSAAATVQQRMQTIPCCCHMQAISSFLFLAPFSSLCCFHTMVLCRFQLSKVFAADSRIRLGPRKRCWKDQAMAELGRYGVHTNLEGVEKGVQ